MKPEINKPRFTGSEDTTKNSSNGTLSNDPFTRRSFLYSIGLAAAAIGLNAASCSSPGEAPKQSSNALPIQGFEKQADDPDVHEGWKPVSDRKIRMGIVGYGVCKFGAAFGFQNHPNVEIVAVSDLFADRRAALAKACGCDKTYPSLEELVKDDKIEAVFLATDAASHGRHTLEVLKHGKHVALCVPAVLGSLEEADQVFEAVKKTGLKYMMFETSCFHKDLYAMRQIYRAGGFGKIIYSEGEYFHPRTLDANGRYVQTPSYRGWRIGLPPQWYPTHSNAYYVGITGDSFTGVSCLGMPSAIEAYQASNNRYKNPFGTEIAMYRTAEGGMSRMGVSWDTRGFGGEVGRVRGQRGSFYGKYEGLEKTLPDLNRPPLPPGVPAGSHGGSHGYLMSEFIEAILQDRRTLIDADTALNMTVPGIIAHESALKGGELMKIPQFII